MDVPGSLLGAAALSCRADVGQTSRGHKLLSLLGWRGLMPLLPASGGVDEGAGVPLDGIRGRLPGESWDWEPPGLWT